METEQSMRPLDATQLSREQAWGRQGLMAVAAVRYCLGRRSYIVSDCAAWLCEVWQVLPENTKAITRRDVEDAFKSDDDDRERGREFLTLGDDCDRASWKTVRHLWSSN